MNAYLLYQGVFEAGKPLCIGLTEAVVLNFAIKEAYVRAQANYEAAHALTTPELRVWIEKYREARDAVSRAKSIKELNDIPLVRPRYRLVTMPITEVHAVKHDFDSQTNLCTRCGVERLKNTKRDFLMRDSRLVYEPTCNARNQK